MPPELYKEAAKIHLEKDVEVSSMEVKNVEIRMNLRMEQFAKALKLGIQHSQVGRVKQAFRSVDNPPPPMYFLIKDHKLTLPGSVCPTTRPVCGATDGLVARFQNLLSCPLQIFAEEFDTGTKCDSSEDMIRSLHDANNKIENNKIKITIILSMDVCSLYPSLEKTKCRSIIKNVIKNSEVEMIGVDWREVILYLMITEGKEEMTILGLGEVLPIRSCEMNGGRKGRKVTLTYLGKEFNSKGEQKWNRDNSRKPTNAEKKVLMSIMLGEAVESVMGNHVYIFGKVYRQATGKRGSNRIRTDRRCSGYYHVEQSGRKGL